MSIDWPAKKAGQSKSRSSSVVGEAGRPIAGISNLTLLGDKRYGAVEVDNAPISEVPRSIPGVSEYFFCLVAHFCCLLYFYVSFITLYNGPVFAITDIVSNFPETWRQWLNGDLLCITVPRISSHQHSSDDRIHKDWLCYLLLWVFKLGGVRSKRWLWDSKPPNTTEQHPYHAPTEDGRRIPHTRSIDEGCCTLVSKEAVLYS